MITSKYCEFLIAPILAVVLAFALKYKMQKDMDSDFVGWHVIEGSASYDWCHAIMSNTGDSRYVLVEDYIITNTPHGNLYVYKKEVR